MSSRNRSRIVQSGKFAEKRKKKLIGAVVIFCLFVAVVAVFIFVLLRLPFIQISRIDVSGTEASTTIADVQSIALKTLSGSYARIIPRSNIVFYPKKEIEKNVTDSLSEVQSIAISRNGFSGLRLSVTERNPAALICEGFPDDSPADDTCFFADTDGFVFQKVDDNSFNISSSSLMRYYTITDKGDGIVGSDFMDSTEFQAIEKFVDGSARAGIIPTGVLIGDDGQYEMYVQNSFKPDPNNPNSGITVYFDDKSSLDTVLSNFVAFWDNIQMAVGSKATTTPNFDYINLRYGDNIFYSTK